MGAGTRSRTALFAVATSVVLGCGDDREPMWIDLDRLLRHVEALEDDLRSHQQKVERSNEMTAVAAVEREFGGQARAHVDAMAAHVRAMQDLCARPDGRPPEVAPIGVALADVRRDMTVHISSMTLSLTAMVARAEEERYQSTAPEGLAKVRDRAEEVAAGAAAYVCQLHN